MVFLIIIVIAIFGGRVLMEYQYPLRYEVYIYEYANENHISPYLVMAMIRTESNFIHDAVSQKDAKGLMQMMDNTAYWVADQMNIDYFKINDLNDPETNIRMGTWYMSYLLEKYDDNEKTALAAYNGGMGNVSKWLSDKNYSDDGETLKKIPYRETEKYVDRVLEYKKNYERFYKDK